MDKEQALNNLYALRAGLSAISQEYEKTVPIEDECDERLTENAKNFSGSLTCFDDYPELKKLRERYGYKEDLTEEINAISEESGIDYQQKYSKQIELENVNTEKGKKAYARWLANDESDNYFKNIYDGANRKKDLALTGDIDCYNYKKASKYRKTLSILFFILAAVTLIVPVFIVLKLTFSTGVIVFLFLIPSVFLILGIVFACLAASSIKAHKYEVNNAQDKVTAAYSLLEKLPQVRERARAILKQKDEKIAPIKESCNEFYMALKKQFNPILDERDWKNLDLVIYELETRRADSVKEALQLVDRELQTERIQQTIVQATEQIYYEIRRGFAEMRETIIECSRIISAQLSAVSLQLGEISGQLSDLCDSVNLGNALQAKANVTSAQLLSDVHAIRYYQ